MNALDEWLLDTNILVTLIQPGTPLFAEVTHALRELRQRNAALWIAPQTLSEFYATLTRPVRMNPNGTPASNSGFGKPSADALREVAAMETTFGLLDDHAGTFAAWKALVAVTGATGIQCFDIRLAAIMQVYGIPNLLTFNGADFAGVPGITVKAPVNI